MLQSPSVVLVEVSSLIVAHLLTVLVCWAVITRVGKRKLFETIGWKWAGPTPVVKVLFVAGIVALMFALEIFFNITLPQTHETDFAKLLKTSQAVRELIAFMAVFSAPLVEEGVYRGVVYSGLRRAAGMWPAVIIVTVLFAGVHVPQYWGAWGGLAGILALSFTLTIIRAKTKSILPCFVVHTLFNAIGAFFILLGHGG